MVLTFDSRCQFRRMTVAAGPSWAHREPLASAGPVAARCRRRPRTCSHMVSRPFTRPTSGFMTESHESDVSLPSTLRSRPGRIRWPLAVDLITHERGGLVHEIRVAVADSGRIKGHRTQAPARGQFVCERRNGEDPMDGLGEALRVTGAGEQPVSPSCTISRGPYSQSAATTG